MGGAGKNIMQYYTSNTGFNCTLLIIPVENPFPRGKKQANKKQPPYHKTKTQTIFKLELKQ